LSVRANLEGVLLADAEAEGVAAASAAGGVWGKQLATPWHLAHPAAARVAPRAANRWQHRLRQRGCRWGSQQRCRQWTGTDRQLHGGDGALGDPPATQRSACVSDASPLVAARRSLNALWSRVQLQLPTTHRCVCPYILVLYSLDATPEHRGL